MRISRHYTKKNQSPYEEITFRSANSEIRNPDGSIVFSAENVEVPDELISPKTEPVQGAGNKPGRFRKLL